MAPKKAMKMVKAKGLEKPNAKHTGLEKPKNVLKLAMKQRKALAKAKAKGQSSGSKVLEKTKAKNKLNNANLKKLGQMSPGKVSAIKPSERLGLIFEEVQAQYKEQLLENRLTNLKLSMFISDPKSPWASRASLDCKAGESKHLLPALVPVLEKMFEGTTKPEELHMLSAASSLEKLVSLWDAADLFLTEEQFAQSLTLGKEFLDSYKWLNSWSLEKGRNSFGIVAKFHTFIHLLWNCQFGNPRGHWNFRGEDFVGHMSKMAHSVSFGVSSCKISQKLAQKYRLLVHFLLSREMEMDELDHLLDNWSLEKRWCTDKPKKPWKRFKRTGLGKGHGPSCLGKGACSEALEKAFLVLDQFHLWSWKRPMDHVEGKK